MQPPNRCTLIASAIILLSLLSTALLIVIKLTIDEQTAYLCNQVLELNLDMSKCHAHNSNLSWIIVSAFAVTIVLLFLGSYLLISARPKTQKKEFKIVKTSELSDEEKIIYELLRNKEGSVYQHEIVTLTGYGKVRITRILDKLENKDIIERKRRGMTNIVILK